MFWFQLLTALYQEIFKMEVGLLTLEQKNLLVGVLFKPASYFNHILDGNNPPLETIINTYMTS